MMLQLWGICLLLCLHPLSASALCITIAVAVVQLRALPLFSELSMLARTIMLILSIMFCIKANLPKGFKDGAGQRSLSHAQVLHTDFHFDVYAVIAVDLTQGQTPLPDVEPPIPGNHDLAATLKALAANSTSFGGSSAAQSAGIDPDGVDPEMIARSGHYCISDWHCCKYLCSSVTALCDMTDNNSNYFWCCMHCLPKLEYKAQCMLCDSTWLLVKQFKNIQCHVCSHLPGALQTLGLYYI